MSFKPVETRNAFQEFQLERVLNTAEDGEQAMGNIATHRLSSVIEAWLVGLNTEIAPVLPRVIGWLRQAIQDDERFGDNQDFHRLKLHWASAPSLWMRDGMSSPGHWELVRQFSDASLRSGAYGSQGDVSTNRLNDYMGFCFQAEQYEIGVAEFKKCHGTKPVDLKKSLSPSELGYALCLHKARGDFDAQELFAAGRRMLRAHLDQDWLGMGQMTRGATWLKVVYWHHDPSLTPLRTILHAYDDMPKVPRPEFLPV